MENKEIKTGYDWCLESNMRVLDLLEIEEEWYYATPVNALHFLDWIGDKKIKPNSTPRKTDLYLEYRMYGIVSYNISGIQAGIQFGHAVVEYQQNARDMGKIEDIYNRWAQNDKTFIICNGGTTNNDVSDKWYGSMQKFRDGLEMKGITYAEFHEPDLNNALSAVVFLVDERVFNEELYPNYVDMPYPWSDKGRGYRPKEVEKAKWELDNHKNHLKWIEKIGGGKNAYLRQVTNKHVLRLANN